MAQEAVPMMNNAGGKVERAFIEISREPIIPLKKTLTVARLKPNAWLKVNNHKLRLFILSLHSLFIAHIFNIVGGQWILFKKIFYIKR